MMFCCMCLYNKYTLNSTVDSESILSFLTTIELANQTQTNNKQNTYRTFPHINASAALNVFQYANSASLLPLLPGDGEKKKAKAAEAK